MRRPLFYELSLKLMPIFDAIVMVDWSAKATPGPARPQKDNIFIAEAGGPAPVYHRTRVGALADLTARAQAAVQDGRRMLIGFDFPFGYPTGTARALTGRDDAFALWSHLAARMGDAQGAAAGRFALAADLNARFVGQGPFWGRPAGQGIQGLDAHKPPHLPEYPPERRAAELAARGASTLWQLLGVGAVGSQALTGIPALERLRRADGLAGKVAIWPFDTDFAPPDAPVTLAEIYPSLIQPAVDAACAPDEILDAAQVRVLADAFAALDRRGALAALFAAPDWLAPEALAAAAREEGWILGLQAPMPPAGRIRKIAALRIAAPALSDEAEAAAALSVAARRRKTPLPIIGINEDGFDGLSPAARAALLGADAVLGGDRHPDLPVTGARLPWPDDRKRLMQMLRTRGTRRLAVLVHGDPLWYSLGAKITVALGADDVAIHPNLSTFQLVAARLGWSMADAETLSCHRKPAERILPFVAPRARLLIIATGAETPGRIARLLTARGWGESRLSLFSAIGGAHEDRVDAPASNFPATNLPFAALAVLCIPGPDAHLLPAGQALPDADPSAPTPRPGITPDLAEGLDQAARAVILARLGPFRGASLAAMGRGAAGVAIDWCRAARDMSACAVPPEMAPPDMIPPDMAPPKHEAAALGAPQLVLCPNPMVAVPDPDAVFLGPGAAHLIDACSAALRRPGRIVVCVDAVGRDVAAITQANAAHGGTQTPLGPLLLWSAILR